METTTERGGGVWTARHRLLLNKAARHLVTTKKTTTYTSEMLRCRQQICGAAGAAAKVIVQTDVRKAKAQLKVSAAHIDISYIQ